MSEPISLEDRFAIIIFVLGGGDEKAKVPFSAFEQHFDDACDLTDEDFDTKWSEPARALLLAQGGIMVGNRPDPGGTDERDEG